jgi:uncharacterized protein YecT (DUF1311 family)
MFPTRPGILLLLPLLWAMPAAAQEPDCANAVDQADMTACAGLDYEAADRELNTVWRDAIADAKTLDEELKTMGGDGRPGHEETLRTAQRAWIGYRDAACEYEGFEARGGSMEPMLASFCLARLTRLRTKELLGEPVSADGESDAGETAQ